MQGKKYYQDTATGADRDKQDWAEDYQAKIVFPVDAAMTAGANERAQDVASLEGEKEERGIVSDRRNFKWIVMNELGARASVDAIRDSAPWQVDELLERLGCFARQSSG